MHDRHANNLSYLEPVEVESVGIGLQPDGMISCRELKITLISDPIPKEEYKFLLPVGAEILKLLDVPFLQLLQTVKAQTIIEMKFHVADQLLRNINSHAVTVVGLCANVLAVAANTCLGFMFRIHVW